MRRRSMSQDRSVPIEVPRAPPLDRGHGSLPVTRALRVLERELQTGVVDALTPTLAAMRQAGEWAEQECFLA